jgi:hypothetical protein
MRKKLLNFILILLFNFFEKILINMFIEFNEPKIISENKFLPKYVEIANLNNKSDNDQVAQYLGTDFTNPFFQNIKIFIFNNFMEAIGNVIKQKSYLTNAENYTTQKAIEHIFTNFPLSGIYFIEIKTKKIKKNKIEKENNNKNNQNKTKNSKKIKLKAKLWYNGPFQMNNDHCQLFLLSKDSIILNKDDKFSINLENEYDKNLKPSKKNTFKEQYQLLPLNNNDNQKNNCPKTIRLKIIS